ncbi:ATP-binding cassette domain-containing protein [Acidihalobacter ferrooxydans]|uniref:ABC transporter domain-containing protein n=1 Tax=Acidihalobacter ferrooxydans TaxID=1765967 RepID=A0A1P8UJH5_9GAMM|nr:ATP-binding cassette domain-containing protein [Acidihalobacter ferrooxydans]APZ43996.1 hypothetical protein BW247_13600 [Acidihalobacter ferrooxydans]
MNKPVLEFRQVGAREGKRRHARWPLRKLDVEVADGAVLGVAGVGKSLWLELACGWRAPDEGQVLIAGHSSLRLPSAVAAGVIWLGEGQPVWPRLKAIEALGIQADLHAGSTNKSDWQAALEQVDLAARAGTPCHRLTPGEKTRLQLALLWACAPRLVLIDAAVLDVDDALATALAQRIETLAQAGTAFVLGVTQPRWAESCERVLWLPEGRVTDTAQASSLQAMTLAVSGVEPALTLAKSANARIVSGEPGAVRLVSTGFTAWPDDVKPAPQTPTLGDAFAWQALKNASSPSATARQSGTAEPLLRLTRPGLRPLDADAAERDGLHCAQGEIVALTGAGASGLLAALVEGRRLEGTQVELFGRKRADFALRRRLGYLPPQPPAQMDYPAQAWLGWRAGVLGLSSKQAKARISEWSARLGVQAALPRPWAELRFAEKRLLQLLAAWLHQPALLLLDRPFAGLDPLAAETVRSVLLAWAAQGAGIVHVAAHYDEVWFADRAYQLERPATMPHAPRQAQA